MAVIKRRSSKSGLPPGSLVHIGEDKRDESRVTVIYYSPSDFVEKLNPDIEECAVFRDKPGISWINIDGLHRTSVIEKIGDCFGLHPLILEDIVNTEQRPKTEDYDKYLFVVLRMLTYDKKESHVKSEQVSLVLGPSFVLSFQEDIGDVWDSVRERLRNNKGRTRKEGTDYLAYSLMDAIVDNYFNIMEKLGDDIEDIEEELITVPTRDTLRVVHDLKREMIALRKSVWPLRDVIHNLQDTDNPVISPNTKIYLRDIYDHTIQIIDNIESARDIVSGMLDIYLSSVSNRLNEIVKVLTILSAIFIPLTFIAGVYGMNFDHMPELSQPWAYPAVLLMMAVVAAGLVTYFKLKKWF
jgi:magnesium transporter